MQLTLSSSGIKMAQIALYNIYKVVIACTEGEAGFHPTAAPCVLSAEKMQGNLR